MYLLICLQIQIYKDEAIHATDGHTHDGYMMVTDDPMMVT